MKIGKIEKYLYDELKKHGAIHMTLIDPDKSGDNAGIIAREAEKA